MCAQCGTLTCNRNSRTLSLQAMNITCFIQQRMNIIAAEETQPQNNLPGNGTAVLNRKDGWPHLYGG